LGSAWMPSEAKVLMTSSAVMGLLGDNVSGASVDDMVARLGVRGLEGRVGGKCAGSISVWWQTKPQRLHFGDTKAKLLRRCWPAISDNALPLDFHWAHAKTS
jgi:hypothetical protein